MSHPDAYRNWKNSYNQQHHRQQYPGSINVYSRPSTPVAKSPHRPRAASSPVRSPVVLRRLAGSSVARTPVDREYPSQWTNVSMASPRHNSYTRSGVVYKQQQPPPSAAATPTNRGDNHRGHYHHQRNHHQEQPQQKQPQQKQPQQQQPPYHQQHPLPEDKNQILRRLFLQKNIDITNSVKLGAGRYSKVITARQYQNMESGVYKKIAIKVINKEKVTTDFREKFLPREIDCWRQLHHPNLVRILGHYEALKYVFLSMEYGERGDLLAYVQKNGPVPGGQARNWLRMIIHAVGHMHSLRIAHRDLKLENCILFEGGVVKVADFGFARKVASNPSQTYCGSKSYSPPEILMGHPYNPFKADVWSIGVIGFIIVTDTMPFRENMHNYKIVDHQKNRAYSYPSKLTISPACKSTMDEMMTFDQNLRPTVFNCLRLPFFTSAAEEAGLPRTH